MSSKKVNPRKHCRAIAPECEGPPMPVSESRDEVERVEEGEEVQEIEDGEDDLEMEMNIEDEEDESMGIEREKVKESGKKIDESEKQEGEKKGKREFLNERRQKKLGKRKREPSVTIEECPK